MRRYQISHDLNVSSGSRPHISAADLNLTLVGAKFVPRPMSLEREELPLSMPLEFRDSASLSSDFLK